MARIQTYQNDSIVTVDDKVIGTDAVDNSTKNFTVGDILALGSAGTAYTAGTGIDITNNVISSTVVNTDTNNFVSNVVLNGTDLDFTGTGGAFQSSVPLSAIADQTVTLTGASGIAVAGTYPNFTISSTAPTAASPESLILNFASSAIPVLSSPGTELSFNPIGQLAQTNSLHINPVELSLPNATEIEVVNACTAKVSLGAYINNGGQAGHITFEFYEYLLGPPTLLGSASFYISNQATSPAPTTFLSFFDFQAGAIYKFTAYSANHAMIILPGSFIQIEILK